MMFWENFYKNVDKYPHKKAFVFEDDSITYSTLAQHVHALAAYINVTFPQNKPIAIYGDKQTLMPTCFLAVAITGRAYIPIDVETPQKRIEEILEISDASCLFAVSDLSFNLPVKIIHYMELCQIAITKNKYIFTPISSNTIFYILFTSGTTGDPKGIQISLGNLTAFLLFFTNIDAIAQSNIDSILNQAIYSFDLSVADVYFALFSGSTHYSFAKNTQKNFVALYQFMKKTNVELMVLTPSFAEYCLLDSCFSSSLLPNLKVVYFCGEILNNTLVKKLWKRFSNLRIVNAYGPTESTVSVTWCEIFPEYLNHTRLPMGKLGQDYFLHNSEIIISGPQVGKAYKTDVNDGFYTENNMRYFATGDLAQQKGDLLYFTTRKDSQVKRGGYRIELEEIKAKLLSLPYIVQAAVITTNTSRLKIYAFVVLISGFNYSSTSIKNDFSMLCPAYMLPDQIRILASLPITANGKCDYKALEKEVL